MGLMKLRWMQFQSAYHRVNEWNVGGSKLVRDVRRLFQSAYHRVNEWNGHCKLSYKSRDIEFQSAYHRVNEWNLRAGMMPVGQDLFVSIRLSSRQ